MRRGASPYVLKKLQRADEGRRSVYTDEEVGNHSGEAAIVSCHCVFGAMGYPVL